MVVSEIDIRTWLIRAEEEGATHVLVACDTFTWEDYPVIVQAGEDVREQIEKYQGKNMQKVMEVYNLAMDRETQLGECRAWHL